MNASPEKPWKPSKSQLDQGRNQTVPDLLRPGLKVVFCGINPSLYSAAVGHHFARPGNRFWPVIHAAGFTATALGPFQELSLLDAGYGLTNIVERATARADELTRADLDQGATQLAAKLERYRPRIVAFLGVGAYRAAFQQPRAEIGVQATRLSNSLVWVLPNPSGLNAHYQKAELVALFQTLKDAADKL